MSDWAPIPGGVSMTAAEGAAKATGAPKLQAMEPKYDHSLDQTPLSGSAQENAPLEGGVSKDEFGDGSPTDSKTRCPGPLVPQVPQTGSASDDTPGGQPPLTGNVEDTGDPAPPPLKGSTSGKPQPKKTPAPTKPEPKKTPPGPCDYVKPGQSTFHAPMDAYNRSGRRDPVHGRRKYRGDDQWVGDYKYGKPSNGTYTFPGDAKPSPTWVYPVTVGGQTIPIIMSPSPPRQAGMSLPTKDQVAQALTQLPPRQLAEIKEVVLSPQASPGDAVYQKLYKNPNHHAMATGADGTMTFYPQRTYEQSEINHAMIHEGGHIFSERFWSDAKNRTPAEKNFESEWKNAIKDDGKYPSEYSKSAPKEDFSEALTMYTVTKGTPCEDAARKLYPNRYRLLDELLWPPMEGDFPATGTGDTA